MGGYGVRVLRGRGLIAAITSVCSSGFLLFGYDQGVMSGVVVSSYWLHQMGNPSTLMVGTITALYDVGAVAGAIAAAFTAERLGRKRTLLLGTWITIVGTILMGSCYERIQMMVARVITGIGIGFVTSATPVYQSEISVAAQRGWQVCCQLSTMLFGLMIAYWVNYGFYFHRGSVQWRFPLLFQLVFAVYIVLLAPFLPDTPRWLMRHDSSVERGIEVISRLRDKPEDHPQVQAEAEEIQEAIRIESQEEGSWMDLFRSNGISAHKRFYLALGIQFMQQLSGINIVTYYAPTLFQSSLGMSSEMSLLMGCLLQVWYILASFVTWFTIDRVGRRLLLISMAVGMCIVLICEAICVRIDNTASNIAAVVFVFLFEACFTWGWMACVWIYPPEILPLKIRAKGAALAAAADFLGNFLVVEVTPVGLDNIGYRFYIVFAVLNIANAIVVWLFYPETAGLPLEAVDMLFADAATHDALASAAEKPKGYRKLQWAIVGSSAGLRLLEAVYQDGAVMPQHTCSPLL
ncbi:general substrate transporter [Saccharata proteae CBS 121410]|uniref:General substrate transporter n=1 Tax=Saccharata proteae CBS 121410 TaxID=1314787 RepID=A0A9P4LYS2_9PEZI|nr:general substrate transporter [Saccharata proteae CBS 121410]